MMRVDNLTQGSLAPLLISILLIATAALAAAPSAGAAKKLTCAGKPATITTNNRGKPVSAGRDVITGTRKRDVIVTLGGKDSVDGAGGNDLICLGGGNDYAFGDRGDDRIWGDGGKDYLVGYSGDDRIWGGGGDYSPGIQRKNPGRDGRLVGGTGNDRLFGGKGRDLLRGNEGDDRMYGSRATTISTAAPIAICARAAKGSTAVPNASS